MTRQKKRRLERVSGISVRGSGTKSGSGATAAHEDTDSLTSRQLANLIDVLSEGQILGFADPLHPLRCVALSGTPIENSDTAVFADGTTVVNTPALTTSADHFTSGMVGLGIAVENFPPNTTITAVTDARTLVLSNLAVASGSAKKWSLGGSLNYTNFDFFFLDGAQDQSYVPGFEAAESIVPVGGGSGVEVSIFIGPWTQRISDSSIDAVRIDMVFPQMRSINVNNNGDISGTSVQIKIEIKAAANLGGSVFVPVVNDTITGKATNPYNRSYRLDLSGLPAPWDIRVTRITPDSATPSTLQNKTYVVSYSQITYGKLRYPNTSLVAFKIDAVQFGSIPTRAYFMMGLIIRVPKNYDPIARTYDESYSPSGTAAARGVSPSNTWDGTFKYAWTNNPAWCYYDMDSHMRYGLGPYMPEGSLNKWALYNIAKYSDARNARPGGSTDDYDSVTGKNGVPDGHGGFEPRFMCNLYLQKKEDAMKVLTDMATIFRGMHYFANGVLEPIQDSPRTPDIQFGPTNVINGVFLYSGTARKARHTAAQVTWNDNNNFGQATVEGVEDGDAILKYGYNALIVTNMGCTSQMAARRTGRWMLAAEQLLTDTVSFDTGAEGFRCRPGWIAQITNPFRSGRGWSGRILARTSTLITLDRSVTIEAGKTYYIAFTYLDSAEPDPTLKSKVIAVQATNGVGDTTTISVAAMANLPEVGGLWQLANDDVVPELFRILNVTPKDNATVSVVALQYNASLYDHIDDDAALITPPTYSFPSAGQVLAPGAVVIDQVAVNDATGVSRDLHISWIKSQDKWLRGYRVAYRFNSGNWVALPESPATENIIVGAIPGFYEVSVVAINNFGKTSTPVLVYPVTALDVPVTLPAGTVSADTDGFPIAGSFYINTSGGSQQLITYTGKTATQFTGCTGGTGSAGSGNVITGTQPGYTVLFGENPLAGATVSGLEIVGQGSTATFGTPDVEFGWRINSPTWNADLGGPDPTGLLGGRFDPFFQAFVVTMYKADGVTVIQDPVLLSAPRYNFTLEANKRSLVTGAPFSSFTIGVKILDSFNNLSAEAKFTVTKNAPGAPLNPVVTPGPGYATLSCTCPIDPSLAKVNFYRDSYGSSDFRTVAASSGKQITVDFGNLRMGGTFAFFCDCEDVFGNKTAYAGGTAIGNQTYQMLMQNPANAGTPPIPLSAISNDLLACVASPAGGNVPGIVSVSLACPSPNVQIRYTTDGSAPMASSALYASLFNVDASGGAVTVKAAAFYLGFMGPITTWVFTQVATNVVAPSFSPVPGIYQTTDGTQDVTISTPTAADYMFYTKTTNGSAPATPTHDGATPPNATGGTIRITGASAIFSMTAGRWRISVLAYKSGWTDSAVTSADYTVSQTPGAPGGGGHLPP
jgi:predicted phage tail protein